jgi:hypothetical protein
MINRLEATRYLVEQLSDEPIIASCGNPKFDLFTAAEKPRLYQESVHGSLEGCLICRMHADMKNSVNIQRK